MDWGNVSDMLGDYFQVKSYLDRYGPFFSVFFLNTYCLYVKHIWVSLI